MIQKITLFAIIFCISTLGYAQKDWEKLIKEKPKTILEEAEKMQKEAIKSKNSPLYIHSLILQARSKVEINDASYPEIIKEFENHILNSKDEIEKSFLHMITADLYMTYYERNRWEIRQRSMFSGQIPESIEEWSKDVFMDKITHHALEAGKEKKLLQKCDMKKYGVLLKEEYQYNIRPTVFDFIAYQKIELLKKLAYTEPFACDHRENYLMPLTEFIHLDIPLENIGDLVSSIYQELLAFRMKDNNPEALLAIDLSRINYEQNITNKATAKEVYDSLYIKRLDELDTIYNTIPAVMDVIVHKVAHYSHLADYNKRNGFHLKALETANYGIKKYPNTPQAEQLKSIIRVIEEPFILFNMKEEVYPGEQTVNLHYYNTDKVTIKISRINESTPEYYQKKHFNKAINEEHLTNYTFSLPKSLHIKDTTLKITIPQSGLYELIVTPQEFAQKPHLIFCTPFHSVFSTRDTVLEFVVRDAVSGQPLKNTNIILYTTPNRYEENGIYQKVDELKTDQNGIAQYSAKSTSLNKNQLSYEVVSEEHPCGKINYIYSFYYPQTNYSSYTQLYTDRKIYRPGQTVYYKGISYSIDDTHNFVNQKKLIEVEYYNTNYQLLNKQSLTTNNWGSFEGKFTIPRETLNGYFFIRADGGRATIQVADYKLPEFEILLDTLKEGYRFGDTIQLSGKIRSYSGTNVTGAKISYQISLQQLMRWDVDEEVYENGFLTTDMNGNFTLSFVAKQGCNKQLNRWYSSYYQVSINATDSKGESISASTTIPIGKESYNIAVNLPENVNKNRTRHIAVKTLNHKGKNVPSVLYYNIDRLAPLAHIDSSYSLNNINIVASIAQGEINTEKDSIRVDFSSWESGTYLLSVRDRIDTTIKEQQIFHLYSETDKKTPLHCYNWFVAEKTKCAIGEEAVLLIGSSAKDVYVLYEIYNQKRLVKREHIKLSEEVLRLTLPYQQEYSNEIQVSLSFVKDQHFFNNNVTIYKKRKNKDLVLRTTVFRDLLIPGQKETWSFVIENNEKNPVISEIMAVMYDRALDYISPHSWAFSPNEYIPYRTASWGDYYYRNTSASQGDFYFYTPDLITLKPNYFNYYGLAHYWQEQLYRPSVSRAEVQYNSSRFYNKIDRKMFTGSSDGVKVTDCLQLIGDDEIEEEKEEALSPVSLRKNFNETAFFYPNLYSDKKGEFKISFTVPEAVTSWKLMVLAHTQDLEYGYMQKEITTIKELTVKPNLPRFFRAGDHSVVKATINSLAKSVLKGKAYLELFNPGNDDIILKREVDFNVNANQSTTVDFNFTVPEDLSLVGCRIVATTPDFSDGEQHLIGIAPNEILITESMPIFSTEKGEQKYSMTPANSKRKDYRLTFEMTSNPIWHAVTAIPAIQDNTNTENAIRLASAYYVNAVNSQIINSNPSIVRAIELWEKGENDLSSKLEENEELKSILTALTPWASEAQNETARMRLLKEFFNANRLNNLKSLINKKLLATQNHDGSWGWVKGMTGSAFITSNVLLATMRSINEDVKAKMKVAQKRAVNFLDEEINDQFKGAKNTPSITYNELIYLYTRSLFRDIPLTYVMEAHKHYMELLKKEWLKFSPYEKALAATTLFRYGFKEEAARIINSLREHATTSEEMGMYWANNRSSVSYVNSAILTHTSIMEAFYEIDPDNKEINLMKLWLLRQKQTQNWGEVPSTVNAIYALLLTGDKLLEQSENAVVNLGKHRVKESSDYTAGYVKESFSADRIKPDMLNVKVVKSNNTPSWGALYLQYFTPLESVRKKENESFRIEKTLFVEEQTGKGRVLVPIANKKLNTGDKIVVRLNIQTDRDMQYVHLQDLRAACLEPVEQLSGTKWMGKLNYYQETKNVFTNFFFNYLPQGTHIIEYSLWVNQSGTYQDGIATLQCQYAPEFISHSTTQVLNVE
ncbi:hypothetical protein LJC62_04100 [Odoribacter sp. OttesenSCG-928-A06]|nr:hypothetical protein [Odoribacter sp. OttesenSCG-928-A06]